MLLLDEEMRRSIQFGSWKARWWKEQTDRRTSLPVHLSEGITAYALQHAAAETQRIISWSTRWAAIRERAVLVVGSHLAGKEDQVTVSELSIELDDEDDEDIILDDDEL